MFVATAQPEKRPFLGTFFHPMFFVREDVSRRATTAPSKTAAESSTEAATKFVWALNSPMGRATVCCRARTYDTISIHTIE